jgi:hypothetical protein
LKIKTRQLAYLAVLILLTGTLTPSVQAIPRLEPSTAIAVAQSQSAIATKIRQYLDQYGSYTKVSDTLWTVSYEGKSLKNYDVFVSTIPDSELIVLGVTLATKKELKPSQELYLKLLKFNNDVDSVKVMIDDEGDLLLRADVNGRTMDFQEFKQIIEQVALATDELHSQIKSSLMPE